MISGTYYQLGTLTGVINVLGSDPMSNFIRKLYAQKYYCIGLVKHLMPII
jgi:hypothetical protein